MLSASAPTLTSALALGRRNARGVVFGGRNGSGVRGQSPAVSSYRRESFAAWVRVVSCAARYRAARPIAAARCGCCDPVAELLSYQTIRR